METHDIDIKPYYDYTDQLFELYKQLDLKSIDDLHAESDVRWGDKNFMSYFTDVTRSRPRLHEFVESDFKMYDDFVVLSGDIKFCAGMLHYLYPSVTKAHDMFSSTMIDRRYVMHVGFGYQSVYQFWDRIGDLLWHFFKTGLQPGNVYTARVLNNINPAYKTSRAFINLQEAFDKFSHYFNLRHDVVHHFSLGTELYWQRTAAFRDYNANVALLDKVLGYREALTDCLPLCIDALQSALELILEIEVNEQ